jgi:hypothetical protein
VTDVPPDATTGTDLTPPAPADYAGIALPSSLDMTGLGDAQLAAPASPSSYLPPGYMAPGSSPYLPPPPSGTASVHRTGHNGVIAILSAVLIVVGSAGAVYAALHTGGGTAAAGSVPANVPVIGGSIPTPPPASASTDTVVTPFATVFVPNGFSVTDQGSDYIVLTPDGAGDEAVGVQAEPLTSTTTDAELDQDLLAGDQQNGDPSAAFCKGKPATSTQVVGSGGDIAAHAISICENVTPTGGAAFAAEDGYVDAVAKGADGKYKAVFFEILAPIGQYQAFANSLPAALFTQTIFTDASPLP